MTVEFGIVLQTPRGLSGHSQTQNMASPTGNVTGILATVVSVQHVYETPMNRHIMAGKTLQAFQTHKKLKPAITYLKKKT